MKEIVFPKLTSYQKKAYEWLGDAYKQGKIQVIKAPRQVGKSYYIEMVVMKMALEHVTTNLIYEPSIFLARKVYKDIFKMLEESGAIKSANAQTLEIEFINGSQIYFRSIESQSRGLTCSGLLVLDECAYLPDDVIYTILPLINANNASMILASSPFTEAGYYYTMYMKGMDDLSNILSFDWATEDTSMFLTEDKKQLFKATMTPQKYTTEILGQFLSDEGLLFKNINACIKDAEDNKDIYIGIDYATGSDGDFTVLTVVNNRGQMVTNYRTNNLSPTAQIDWIFDIISQLHTSYNIKTIIAEENSIGSVYSDIFKKKLKPLNLTITDFVTSNSSKREIIESLQLAFENGMITIPNDPVLLNELRRYQMEINLKTKTITYNGARGTHDDTVMSLALAYHAYKKSLGEFRLVFI